MDAELKAYLDAMRQDLMVHTDRVNQETRQDLMAHTERLNQETRVLLEDMRHDLQGVAEGVLTVNDKLDRYMAATDQRLMRIERRLP